MLKACLHILRKRAVANLFLFCQSLQACQSRPRSAPAVSQRWCIHIYRWPAKKSANHGFKKKDLMEEYCCLAHHAETYGSNEPVFPSEEPANQKVSLESWSIATRGTLHRIFIFWHLYFVLLVNKTHWYCWKMKYSQHVGFMLVSFDRTLHRWKVFSHLCIFDLSLFLFSAFFIKCMFTWISFKLKTTLQFYINGIEILIGNKAVQSISSLPCPASSGFLPRLLQPGMK